MKIFYIFSLVILWSASYSFGALEQAKKTSEIVLNEFKKHDNFLRQNAFDEFFQHLDEYQSESSLSGGLDLAAHLKDLIKNALNTYYVSSQSAYQSCGVTINCFQSYLQQLQNTKKDAATKQHLIVFQLLEEEQEELRSAIEKLQTARMNFDEFSADSVVPQLDADYEKYSADSKLQIEGLQRIIKENKNGVLSIVRDSDETRQLKSKIDLIIRDLVRLEKLNNILKRQIVEADILAHKMKTNFEDEFNTMIEVKSQAQMAYDIIYSAIQEDDFSFKTNNLIENSVKKLIDQCGNYRARHE